MGLGRAKKGGRSDPRLPIGQKWEGSEVHLGRILSVL